jgi:hypothetical protein
MARNARFKTFSFILILYFVICIFILSGFIVTPLNQPAYAEPTEVFVIISRVDQLISPDGDAPGDYFAKVKIGNTPFFQESSDVDGPNIFVPGSGYSIDPYWVLTANVDSGLGTIPIVIQLEDDDDPFDDTVDINPTRGKTQLDLQLDLNTGTWSGDVPTNQGFSQGPADGSHDEDGSAKIFFDFAVGDIDRDGIPDKVELSGVRDPNGVMIPDFTNGFGFPMDPCRKTVAVEIDYMQVAAFGHTHKPSNAAINSAVSAFDNANTVPAVTPCPYPGFTKSSGVNLVVDVDDAIPETQFLTFGNGFETVKSSNFNSARTPYFHYNLWVHRLSGNDGGSSGLGETNGNEFIVSLGAFANGVGTVTDQTGTFMHELGHNLGLKHGGNSDVNCKPDYLSVMNYVFQLTGITDSSGNSRFDYSKNVLRELDEEDLVESAGIGDTTDFTFWGGNDPGPGGTWMPRFGGPGNGWLDWDGDTFVDGDTVPVNLNLFWSIDDCRGFIANAQILNGFDDWRNLDYVFRDDDNYDEGVHNVPEAPEMTFEEAESMKAAQEELLKSLLPTANAGPDQTVIEGVRVALDGSASSNAVTYDWAQINDNSVGPTVRLSDPRAAKPTFVAPSVDAETVLTFQLIVSDDQANSSPDTVSITVRDVCPPGQHWDQIESLCVPDTPAPDHPPTLQITSPRNEAQFFTGQTITFEGTARDEEDGELTGANLQWQSNRDGPIGTGNRISVVLSGPPTPCLPEFIGHTITLTATDSDGNSSTAQIVVAVGTVC